VEGVASDLAMFVTSVLPVRITLRIKIPTKIRRAFMELRLRCSFHFRNVYEALHGRLWSKLFDKVLDSER
jgi:hypothetical protein